MRWARSLFLFVQKNAAVLAVLPGPLLLIGVKLLQGQVLFWGTSALQFVPWWVEAWRQISQGGFPLWNSLNGMGAPLLANYQTAIFYPPNWLLLPLAAVWGAPGIAFGFTLLSMLHMILAGVGTVYLLRRIGLAVLAQAVGGVAFSLSGYLVGRLEFISMTYVFAWLPWVFLCADRLFYADEGQQQGRRVVFSVSLAAVVAMMLLAGHAQLSWYTLIITFAWVIVKAMRSGWRVLTAKVASMVLASFVGGLLAAVQLLPTAEYLLLSQRSAAVGYTEAVMYSFWPWRVLTLFAPDLFGNPGRGDFWGYATFWEDAAYIGMLPILLGFGTLTVLFRNSASRERKFVKPLVIFLWAFIALGFSLALGQYGVIFPFLYKYVPTFSLFQAPARYMLWVVFGLAILAAVGVDRWRCPENRGLYWLRLATAGAFAVTIGAGLAWLTLGNIKATFIQAAALAGFWALGTGALTLLLPIFERRGRKLAWNCLVYAWVLVDVVSAAWLLNPMISADFYSGVDRRVAELHNERPEQRIYISEEDLRTLKFERFLRFTDFRPLEDWRNLRAVMIPNLNLIEGVGSANNFDPMVPSRYPGWIDAVEEASPRIRNNLLRSAGVGWVEVIDERQPGGVRFDMVETQPIFLYFACAEHADSPEQVLQRFQAVDSSDPLLVVESQQSGEVCDVKKFTPVLIQSQTTDKVVLTVNAPAGGWISAAMTYYPGWEARIDGHPARLLRANYLFMAVPIEPGEHSIVLQYRPRSFFLGAMLSILVLVMLAVVLVRAQKKKPIIETNHSRFNGDS